MLLLREAQAKVATVMEQDFSEDYGADVQYSNRCRRRFTITVNDWVGEEVTRLVRVEEISKPAKLLWLIHGAIEELNVRAS